MTSQEIYNYIKENIEDHLPVGDYIADEYVKAGYGQVRGGYFEVAYKKDVVILKKTADPSQKWHLLNSYYDEKMKDNTFNMQAPAKLNRLMCPQLMMWIAEIAGLDRNILQNAMNAAINFEKMYDIKDSRKIKKLVLNEALHWEEITNIIQLADSWKEVMERVKRIA